MKIRRPSKLHLSLRAALYSFFCCLTISSSPQLASAIPVTFQVNMTVPIAQGTFSPDSGHKIEVHGSFNDWGAGFVLTPNATNPSLYEKTQNLPGGPGSQIQYKFVINQSGNLVWEVNGVGPNGAQNRSVTLQPAGQTIPIAHFNNVSAPPSDVEVTFELDLSIQQILENFNPDAGHLAEVRGSFNNWRFGIPMTEDPERPGIHQATTIINGSEGAITEFKFVINQNGSLTWEGNVGPGGPTGNRIFNLGLTPQFLPVIFFNNLTNNPGQGTPVTFQLDLTIPVARGIFDPANGIAIVAGDFNKWSTSSSPLTNTLDNPTLFSGTYFVNNAAPGSSIPYKFLLNGGQWETGDNRTFTLERSAQILPISPFDIITHLGPISVSVSTADPASFELTWIQGPGIRLQHAPQLSGPWEDVPDSLGQATASFTPSSNPAPSQTYFRLQAD